MHFLLELLSSRLDYLEVVAIHESFLAGIVSRIITTFSFTFYMVAHRITNLFCDKNICPAEVLRPSEDCNVNVSSPFSLQVGYYHYFIQDFDSDIFPYCNIIYIDVSLGLSR